MSQSTACAVFSVDELWLLQAAIRHEIPQGDQWRFPPASLALNDQVADALLRCEEQGLTEAALLLTRADCLAMDFGVQQGAKSAAGVAIGKSVLMKSFRARRELDEGLLPLADEESELAGEDLAERIARWQKRRRRRNP